MARIVDRDQRRRELAGVHEFDGVWNLVSMWITPHARGTGVIDALMNACENAVHESGADRTVLA